MNVERYGRNSLTVVDEVAEGSGVYGSVGPDDLDAMERFGIGRLHYARQFGSLWNYTHALLQFQKRRAKKVLHAGCGQDPLRSILSQNYCMADEYVGIDAHLPNLRKALMVTNSIPAKYYCQDLSRNLQWEDGHFDAVVALDVVEHLPSKENGSKLVFELARVASDLLIISTPSTPGGVVRASDVHKYEFSPEELGTFRLSVGKKFKHSKIIGFHMSEDAYVDRLTKFPDDYAEILKIHEVLGARVGRGMMAMIYPELANDVIMCFSNSAPIEEGV